MSGFFVLFSLCYVINPISYKSFFLEVSDAYILVKKPLEKLHLHPLWFPKTHNNPHETGAAHGSATPFAQKKKPF